MNLVQIESFFTTFDKRSSFADTEIRVVLQKKCFNEMKYKRLL